jgi:hypothetical protein
MKKNHIWAWIFIIAFIIFTVFGVISAYRIFNNYPTIGVIPTKELVQCVLFFFFAEINREFADKELKN